MLQPVEINCTKWLIWSIEGVANRAFVCGDRTIAKIAAWAAPTGKRIPLSALPKAAIF
jgi:hypothetical protein